MTNAPKIGRGHEEYEWVTIESTVVRLPPPDRFDGMQIVEREDIMEKALAAWSRLDATPPLNIRFYGPSGVGKSMIPISLAKALDKDLYIMDGSEEIDPDWLICTPHIDKDRIIYHGTAILSAVLKGGILFFDEIGKVPRSALSKLHCLLDHRHRVYSEIAGLRLKVHEDFLFCSALSKEEEENQVLGEEIQNRISVAIEVPYPDAKLLEEILRSQLPKAADIWFKAFIKEFGRCGLTPRACDTLLRSAYKSCLKETGGSGKEEDVLRYLRKAVDDTGAVVRKTLARPTDEISSPAKVRRNARFPALFNNVPKDPDSLH